MWSDPYNNNENNKPEFRLTSFLHFKSLFPYLNFTENIWSIMSGDSPHAHRNEVFDYKEDRSSPTPTTSKDVAVQNSGVPGAITAGAKETDAILVENKEREEENSDMASPLSNNSPGNESRESDPEKTLALDDVIDCGKEGDDRKRERKKLNGDIDRLDGVWLPKEQKKKKSQKQDEDDDNCIVKCLYVTMQCCECTIM